MPIQCTVAPAFTSVLMIGLLAAYLIPDRYYPIPSFLPEAFALFAAFLALALRQLAEGLPRKIVLNWSSASAIGFAGWLLLCIPITRPPYPDTLIFTLASLVGAAGIAAAGAQFSGSTRARGAVFIMALSLMLASYLTTLLQAYQYFTPDYATAWLMPRPITLQPFGNLGQRNHTACLHALGLMSAAYFAKRNANPYRWALLIYALAAMAGVVMSGSRSGSILGCFSVIAFVCMPTPEGTRKTAISLAVHSMVAVACYALVYFALDRLLFAATAAQEFDSAAKRWMTYGNVPREVLNVLAWNIFAAHPITGAGWGSFSAQTLARVDDLLLPQYANNSHNLVTQLAAEAGIVGVLLVLVPIATIVLRALRQPQNAVQVYLLGFVAIFLAYSMSEFPLWHTYFLLPFAFVLGLLDRPGRSFAISKSLAAIFFTVYMALGFATWYSASQFIHIAQLVKLVFKSGGPSAEAREYVAANLRAVGFSPQTELLAFGILAVDSDNLRAKIELGERVVRQHIDARLLSRQAALLALDGQHDAALTHLVSACRFYPERCMYVSDELDGAAKLDPVTFGPVVERFRQKIPLESRTAAP